MKYYKVLEEKYDYFTGWTAIENSLVTEKERNTKYRYIADCFFKPVSVSRKQTYMSFGVRFPTSDAQIVEL